MLQKINKFFSNRANIALLHEFQAQNDNFAGSIKISTSKGDLLFEVEIPSTFPFSKVSDFCIKFICEALLGYPHINFDGSVCIHSESNPDVEKRLENEILCLEEWIDRFYIKEEVEEHYHYLPIPCESDCFSLLFSDLPLDYFKAKKEGVFEYTRIYNKTLILQSVDKQVVSWAENIKKLKMNKSVWIFLGKEPVLERRLVITSWKHLGEMLSDNQREAIFTIYTETIRNRSTFFFVMIGYRIKNNSIHWEFVKINTSEIPIRKNITKFKNYYSFLNDPILWQKTYNISYDRFFGRGKLSNSITEKNILIIGVGAIGSQVATILTRGGAKRITLIDFDTVEPGNICRSEYFLPNTDDLKILSLRDLLSNISPYLDIDINPYIDKIGKGQYNYDNNLEYFKKFDIIFDCSTDNEVSYILDNMDLKGIIFNLSITNKANELVCLTGKNISDFKYYIVNAINNYEQPKLMYEGIGCQYPTFEASYADINSLVAFAIKNLNLRFEDNIKFKNLIIKSTNKNYNYSIQLFDYQTFTQKESGLHIVISSEMIERVKQLSLAHYPKEFGGILMGSYLPDDFTLLITNIIEASEYKNSPVIFTREAQTLNQHINDIYTKTSGNIVYVGEWHTHPNSSPNFSQTDFLAMQSIANGANIMTKNPILLINGFDLVKHNLCFYVYKDKKLLKYEKV